MGEAISISDKHLQCTVDLTAQTPPLFSSATLGTDAGLRPEQTCDDCCSPREDLEDQTAGMWGRGTERLTDLTDRARQGLLPCRRTEAKVQSGRRRAAHLVTSTDQSSESGTDSSQ
ncbi:hypothetical protein FQA47_013918 [Oryzias melastigma]|uniref:Uncharacterized protein n=1 Tax=Oryzias melastigma TaxID=30732 RepID=A0A834CIZ4_ORYME|nr:hypothetical protein FQA47_013918 [Oryzias melastigma]